MKHSYLTASQNHVLRITSLIAAMLLSVVSFSAKAAAVEGSVRVMKKEGAPVEVTMNGSPIEIQTGTILRQSEGSGMNS